MELHTIETASVMGAERPFRSGENLKADVVLQLREINPSVVVMNYKPAPDDTPERKRRAFDAMRRTLDAAGIDATVVVVTNAPRYFVEWTARNAQNQNGGAR